MVNRWNQRLGEHTNQEIKDIVNRIVKNGEKTKIDSLHYRICYDGICIIFMNLENHSLAKTVYYREESPRSAI